VTVILPTYNRARSLGRAINSVLAQTHSELTLIVVDDGSTDSTETVVKSLTDERVRYLRLPENRGPAAARNAGIREAATEWIAFQDSDDEWLPTKLEEQLRAAATPGRDVVLVVSGYRLDIDEIVVRPEHTLRGEDPTPDVLDGWPTITPTWLVKRTALEELNGFDETLPCLEDWELALRLTDRYGITAVVGPLLVKHSSVDSVCARPETLEMALREVLRRHGDRWKGERHRLAHRLRHLACLEYRLGRHRNARRTLLRSLVRDPRTPATYALLAASCLGSHAVERAEQRWRRESGMALSP
jgi:glycosyltransferase involved in cell wall biosynthesis